MNTEKKSKLMTFDGVILYVAVVLLLVGMQWMHTSPESKAAGITFAIGAVLLCIGIIIDVKMMIVNKFKKKEVS